MFASVRPTGEDQSLGRGPVRLPKAFKRIVKGVLAIITVKVEGNNVNQAIKKLKKKMEREGFFREIKKRRYYEKPSEKRRRQQMESLRRLRKKMKRRRSA